MPQFLFNDDPLHDTVFVLNFIDNYTKELGLGPIELDTRIIESVIKSCRIDFPHKDGLDKASAFKKVSNFICFFISERPILSPFENGLLEDISSINNHQNAIIGFELARAALHNSTILMSSNDIVLIKNPIKLSKHSYIDIIDALSNVTPVHHFKVVSVLLEQLVYKTNENCQYSITA